MHPYRPVLYNLTLNAGRGGSCEDVTDGTITRKNNHLV